MTTRSLVMTIVIRTAMIKSTNTTIVIYILI
jgi:hypothetical protein